MGIFSHGHTPTVTAAAAIDLLRNEGVLIDVREMDEWLAGHAPTARHIPLSQLGALAGELDKTAPMVVICRSGRRSDHAVNELCKAGYNALNLAGGMQAWQQAGGDVVRDDGTHGMVI